MNGSGYFVGSSLARAGRLYSARTEVVPMWDSAVAPEIAPIRESAWWSLAPSCQPLKRDPLLIPESFEATVRTVQVPSHVFLPRQAHNRSEEHTSELQSQSNLV